MIAIDEAKSLDWFLAAAGRKDWESVHATAHAVAMVAALQAVQIPLELIGIAFEGGKVPSSVGSYRIPDVCGIAGVEFAPADHPFVRFLRGPPLLPGMYEGDRGKMHAPHFDQSFHRSTAYADAYAQWITAHVPGLVAAAWSYVD